MFGRAPGDSRGSVRESLTLEFGVYTDWMSEAIKSLGLGGSIPAACRGTGNPHLFEELSNRVQTSHGSFLDLGCGMGGPAEWFRRRTAASVWGVDVMEEQIAVGRTLFPELVLCTASVSSLPFPDASFDGAWAVGVLEMTGDMDSTLAELRRVLVPGGRVVAFMHVRATAEIDDPPVSDTFVWPDAVERTLSDLSFDVIESEPLDALPNPPADWASAKEAIRSHVASAHEGDPRHDAVIAELDRFSTAARAGAIRPWVLSFRSPSDS